MGRGRRSLVSLEVSDILGRHDSQMHVEHTLLVTEDGVEILTARLPDSPGGPVPMPEQASVPATDGTGELTNGA